MKHAYLWLLIETFLSSCSSHSLTVQTDYLTHKDLASYYVNTPDPRQNITAVGQRLIICWSVPKSYLAYDDLHLEVTIRFRNHEETIELFHLSRARGTYVFALLNGDYLAKEGILTYKVNLAARDLILEEWRHQIWVDLISVNQESHLLPRTANKNEASEDDEYMIDWGSDEPL